MVPPSSIGCYGHLLRGLGYDPYNQRVMISCSSVGYISLDLTSETFELVPDLICTTLRSKLVFDSARNRTLHTCRAIRGLFALEAGASGFVSVLPLGSCPVTHDLLIEQATGKIWSDI